MQNAIRQVYEKLAKIRSVVSCKLDMVKSEANTSLGSQYQSGSINLYLIYIGLKLNFTLTDVGRGGGGYYCTQYKRPYEDMPPTWVAPLGISIYQWPHIYAKFCIWMIRFFNFFWSLSQNWLKSKKIWKTKNNK